MIPVIFGWRPREPLTYDLAPVAQRMPGWVRDPHGPDPVVFGDWLPQQSPVGGPVAACGRCRVRWQVADGVMCWLCGCFATGSY